MGIPLKRLLNDPDNNVREQAFNTIRNLAENEQGVDLVFKEVGEERLLDDIADALSFEVLGGITTGEAVAVGMGEGVGGTRDPAEGTGGTDVRLRHRPNEDVMLQVRCDLHPRSQASLTGPSVLSPNIHRPPTLWRTSQMAQKLINT